MTRMGFVINLDSCMDHRGCMTACKMYKETPMGIYNMKTLTSNDGAFPDPNTYFMPKLCQQCNNPSCVPACPHEALEKRYDGIVVIAKPEACETCEDPGCQEACPYDAITFDPVTKMAYKCDMCLSRLQAREQPRCVRGCLTGSIFTGDFDDPDSMVSQIVASWDGFVHQLKPETGNEPNVYYLLSKKQWQGSDHLFDPNWTEQ